MAETRLRPTLSRRMLTVFLVGDVLGAGVYALVGEVGAETGGAIWTAFALALGLAMLTAASLAELVTKYPRAAGAASYVQRAFRRPRFTFVVGFAVMASGVTSAATLATAFGGKYLAEFVTLPRALVGLAFIAALSAVNLRGIRESARVNLALTAIELAGLLLVAVVAAAFLLDGGGEPARAFEFRSGEAVPPAMLAGAALAFYALIGFEDSVNLAEETVDPARAYPRALFSGLAIAGLVYTIVTVLASMAVPTARLTGSDGPLLEVVRLGPLAVDPRLFSAIALFALANGALMNLIMASRLVYGMADEGVVPRAFARVLPRRRTPWVAILFTSLLAYALVLAGDLATLASTTVLLLLAVFTCVNVAVLVLRREPVTHAHFRAPTAVPVLGAVTCLGLIVQKAVLEPRDLVWAAGLIGAGALLASVRETRSGPRRRADGSAPGALQTPLHG